MSPKFLRTFSNCSQNFLKCFSNVSQKFLKTFSIVLKLVSPNCWWFLSLPAFVVPDPLRPRRMCRLWPISASRLVIWASRLLFLRVPRSVIRASRLLSLSAPRSADPGRYLFYWPEICQLAQPCREACWPVQGRMEATLETTPVLRAPPPPTK